MSKNSKNRHKGKDAAVRKSGHGVGGQGSTSLSTFRAERAVDALTPAFVQWFRDESPEGAPAAIALECLDGVKAVLGRYMQSTAASEVTSLDPVPLALAISDEIMAAAKAPGAEDGDFDDAVLAADGMHAFVDFLSQTGRWTGTQDQLAAVLDFFATVAENLDDSGLIDVPDVSEEQAHKVFANLPLIQRATALLKWIGKGKPVTGTGVLRLRDVEAAAACVGVTVRGSSKRAESAVPELEGPADPVPTVRSMYEVPLLAQIWAAMEAAELIDVKSSKVVPFEDSEAFLAGGASEQLEEFTFFTDCFLEHMVLGFDPEAPWEKTVAGLQVSILIAAASAEPPSIERVMAVADHAPEAEKEMAALLTRMAMGGLEALAELGLLTIDTHIRVPPALIGCVADVFDNEALIEGLGLREGSLEEAGDWEDAEDAEDADADHVDHKAAGLEAAGLKAEGSPDRPRSQSCS